MSSLFFSGRKALRRRSRVISEGEKSTKEGKERGGNKKRKRDDVEEEEEDPKDKKGKGKRR